MAALPEIVNKSSGHPREDLYKHSENDLGRGWPCTCSFPAGQPQGLPAQLIGMFCEANAGKADPKE